MPNKTIKFHSAFHSMVRDGRKTLTQRVVEVDESELLHPASAYSLEFDGEDWCLVYRRLDPDGEVGFLDSYILERPYTVGELLTVDGTTMQVRVASIDCQRLQDTTEEQAKREGFERTDFHSDTHAYIDRPMAVFQAWRWVGDGHLDAIANMWRDIYPSGPKSWESNPVTWPVGFEYAGEVEDE